MQTNTTDLDLARAKKVRELNDTFRTTFQGGRVTMTNGVAALPDKTKRAIMYHVIAFDKFNANNDPHHEHDLGTFEVMGKTVMWKIDYYDPTLETGSEDPADPAKTTRVLTVMLASEY